MYVFAFICGVAVCRTMVKEVKVECSPSRFGHNFTRYSYNFYTLKMIRLYYSRMTFFYYATSLYAVFDNVPPSTIMCGFSVKESQTDAYSIVRQKLYFYSHWNMKLKKQYCFGTFCDTKILLDFLRENTEKQAKMPKSCYLNWNFS